MAKRFVYIPIEVSPYVKCVEVDFVWEKGMSLSQKKLSSCNVITKAKQLNLATRVLECSRAGENDLGVKLSAFNLPYFNNKDIKIENVYQGSKVFKDTETGEIIWLNKLYSADAMAAKTEPILTAKRYEFIEFRLLNPNNVYKVNRIAFYNYIYIKSLMAALDSAMVAKLMLYDGFTDTMLRWYGGKITACQAHAVAMYVGMVKAGVLDTIMANDDEYFKLYN